MLSPEISLRNWITRFDVGEYQNLFNRDFYAETPNCKWVTDISCIHTRQGVLYLSMIRDPYDNSIVVYKKGTEQSVDLVLDTIRLVMKQEKKISTSAATKVLSTPHKHILS